MLLTGKYFGYLHKGRIVSVAGVHVDSEEYGVTVLGSIATLPKFRGKGLATLVTARLLKELVGKREVITLNVDSKNIPAVKCYSNLGFVKTHVCEEGLFTLRK
jgi:predicted GNAT family acetyltransferase